MPSEAERRANECNCMVEANDAGSHDSDCLLYKSAAPSPAAIEEAARVVDDLFVRDTDSSSRIVLRIPTGRAIVTAILPILRGGK